MPAIGFKHLGGISESPINKIYNDPKTGQEGNVLSLAYKMCIALTTRHDIDTLTQQGIWMDLGSAQLSASAWSRLHTCNIYLVPYPHR
jgi:hypothetical protein